VRYARSAAALRAAQATLEHALAETIKANEDSAEDLSPETRASLKLSMLSVLRLAWESIEIGVRGSGTSIFAADSPTQHFVRDMELLLSHQTIDEDAMYAMAGQILLGRATTTSNAVI
jgi:3-hydroxy-9,10-secoandrosta-1,3,5(10)-triene-9,17-dione monooxygenase